MANETTLQIEIELPITFSKATGTAFEQGAFVELADNLTAIAATADDHVGGIVHTEVTVAEASPSVSVYRRGIFRGTASAAVAIGESLALTGSGNKLKPATNANVGDKTVGTALEVASGDNETFLFELNPGVQTNAFA